MILTVILGFAIERAAYKPLRSAPRMSVMISAIGVSYLLQNLAALRHRRPGTGPIPRFPLSTETVNIGGATTKRWSSSLPSWLLLLVIAAGHADQPYQDRHGHACGFQGL